MSNIPTLLLFLVLTRHLFIVIRLTECYYPIPEPFYGFFYSYYLTIKGRLPGSEYDNHAC
jgi:hypothetical protein